MSPFDDDVDDMGPLADLVSDDAVEAFLSGGPGAWEQDAALVAIDRQLAAAAGGPAPAVGPALARLMAPSRAATPLTVVPPVQPAGTPAFRQPARGPRRRLVALVAGAMAAASALPVAAAANVLPAAVHQAVLRMVEAVTPFEFPTQLPESPGDPAGSRAPVTAPPALSSTPPPHGAGESLTPASPATGAPGISGDLPQGPPASLPAAAPQPGTRPVTPVAPGIPGPPTTGPGARPPVSGPAASVPVTVSPGQPPVTTPAPAGQGPATETPAPGAQASANTGLRP